jgi:hypothetical protein
MFFFINLNPDLRQAPAKSIPLAWAANVMAKAGAQA